LLFSPTDHTSHNMKLHPWVSKRLYKLFAKSNTT
jgi:hypothetical protein